MAEALNCGNRSDFWKKVRAAGPKKSHSLASSIDNISGTAAIAEMWKNKFSNLLNEQNTPDTGEIFSAGASDNLQGIGCNVVDVKRLLPLLPLNKYPGCNDISAEFIRFAHPSICIYLSVFFNLCTVHSFIPSQCLETVIVPIIKSPTGDISNSGNYRPIAIASVVSKLFEHLILFKLKPLLTTSDNQFGFKPLHGTDMCTFLLKEVVRSYTTKNTPVYSVFLDASKAFDRVNHAMLFRKLKARSVPGCLLRLLHFWYANQTLMIKWGNCMSDSFNASNGVRQGSVLSPYLFAVYMDDLSSELNKVNAGCIVGNLKLNHIMYADDLCCFCPSRTGLNELLAVCSKYAAAHNIVFNACKSYGMMFRVKYCKGFKPNLSLDGKIIKFVDSVKYLGVFLTDTLSDDCDITRQIKYLYAVGNSLRCKFHKYSIHIKNMLFRAHCCALSASQLWCCYTHESYRRL